MLHTSSTLASSSYSDKSLGLFEDKAGKDLHNSQHHPTHRDIYNLQVKYLFIDYFIHFVTYYSYLLLIYIYLFIIYLYLFIYSFIFIY